MPSELRPIAQLSEATRLLLERAVAVRARAYAPFSKFLVGCGLRDVAGNVYGGCNVENASFGATICAERSAILQMVAAGGRQIEELVVITTSAEAFFPCGLCLQVIQEFGKDAVVVAVDGTGKKFRTAFMKELYPSAFSTETWKNE